MSIGVGELLLILLIILIVFGLGKLPELGSGFAKIVNGFKKEIDKPQKDADEGKSVERKD